jgi:hypothetical protein
MILKTKSILVIISILSILIFESGCKDNKETCFQKVEFTKIGKDNLYGSGKEGIAKCNLIIRSQTEWLDLISKMDSYNAVTDNFTEKNIDFSNYIIIAVFDSIKQNGGHSIDIVDININCDNMVISISNLNKGDMTTVITQPFHIIKVPKTKKLICFDEN